MPNDIYTLLCHRWFWCYTREPPKMLPGDLARARHFPVKITPHFLSQHSGGYFNVKMLVAFSCWQKGCLPRRTVVTKAESKTEMCASASSGQVSTNAPSAVVGHSPFSTYANFSAPYQPSLPPAPFGLQNLPNRFCIFSPYKIRI